MGRKFVDWNFIKPLWVAGGLSNLEICRQYKKAHKFQDQYRSTVDESSIRKKARTAGWKKDLADAIKKAVQEKLVRAKSDPQTTDDQIIEEASKARADVVQLERIDIAALKALETDLEKRLHKDEAQIVIGWYKGKATEHKIKMSLSERVGIYARFVAAVAQRIKLERLAWGIDEKDDDNEVQEVNVVQIF